MKKIVAIFLAILIVILSSIAFADTPDISSLSFDELVELVNKAQMLMMKSDKWQEVEVPEGTYLIGRDIPEGHWTISVVPKFAQQIFLYWGDKVKENGQGIDFSSSFRTTADIVSENYVFGAEGKTLSVSWELKDGQYICIENGSVIFTPFAGNSFSFK